MSAYLRQNGLISNCWWSVSSIVIWDKKFSGMEVFLAAECIPFIREGEKGVLAHPHSGHSTMPFHKTDSNRIAHCFDVGCSSASSADRIDRSSIDY